MQVVSGNTHNLVALIDTLALHDETYGNLLQTAVSVPTLLVWDGHEITEFCFTPQNGNSLLSSVVAAAPPVRLGLRKLSQWPRGVPPDPPGPGPVHASAAPCQSPCDGVRAQCGAGGLGCP